MNDLLPQATLAGARELFPHLRSGRLYLNHAATSPLSTRVVDAMRTHLADRSEGALETYATDMPVIKSLRADVASMIHAEGPERVSFQLNTTEALNVVAAGLPWNPGDRIVVSNIEFPANVYPLLNLRQAGVEVDILPSGNGQITTGMIEDALGPRTRLVAVSAVQYLSGHRTDLLAMGELCRSRGVILLVDGIQAVGAMEIDVREMKIDALAAGAQKWQMSPQGTGFLYLTGELQSRIRQKHLGWLSVADPWQFTNYDQPLAASARRYEGGTLNIIGLVGMQAAIRTLLEVGIPAIERHLLSITGLLMDRLRGIRGLDLITPAGSRDRAGIVTAAVGSGIDPQRTLVRLTERGVLIALREGCLRFSPHFYNTPDEMEKTATIVRECLP
jgi:cysteine desulfurase / selenocysteine lyase